MRQLGIILLAVLVIASCRVEEKIVDGRKAFERKQYAKAIQLLEKEFNKSKSTVEKGEKAFLIGESYRIINQPETSKDWYMKAYNSGYNSDALKQYAFALKELEQYKEAIEAFKDLGSDLGDPYEFQREIIACRQAGAWVKGQKNENTDVSALGGNTRSAEYYPAVYKDGQIIIASDRPESTGEDIYGWTGNKYADLFLLDTKTGKTSNFSMVLNSKYNEATITFNKDFTQAYFSRCGDDGSKSDVFYCKLMYTELIGDEWSEPQVVEFTEDKVNYSHPFLSADGNVLYYSSDHPEGLGGYDIYSVKRTSEGWGEPQNLGASINTEGSETSPYIDVDTLYFSSDYHIGMGGADIFKTVKNGNRWGPLQNLRAPVNSGADDFGFRVDYRKKQKSNIIRSGYFTSNRKGGKGNDDIYRFETRVPPPPIEPVEPIDTLPLAEGQEEPPKIEYKLLLEGRVVEKVFNDPENPNSGVLGKSGIPTATVQVNFRDTSFAVTTNEKGEFKLELEEQMSYLFTGSKTDYLSQDARFSTRGIENDPNNPTQTFYQEIVLDKVFKNVEITLDGIYYDFDRWEIRPDAKPILNKLANILKRNPSIKIELASHTDCKGGDSYNKTLSQKRANSAVEYLIAKGISSSRMVAIGYGEAQPVTTCSCNRCNKEEDQRNRRTTFKIVE